MVNRVGFEPTLFRTTVFKGGKLYICLNVAPYFMSLLVRRTFKLVNLTELTPLGHLSATLSSTISHNIIIRGSGSINLQICNVMGAKIR